MKWFRQDKAIIMPLMLIVVLCSYLTPSSMAHKIVDEAKEIVAHWPAGALASTVENPINANRRSVNRGKRLFDQRCAVCHGDEGAGDGPASKSLSPKPANLTTHEFQEQSDGALYWKISKGRATMPAWEAVLDEDERWNVVNYLRSFVSN